MKLRVLDTRFSVCKVNDLPPGVLDDEFCFIGKTDDELSLVCTTESAPPGTLAREDGWRALRVEGTLEFFLIGVLAELSTTLARAGVSIFAVSTFNTDYILIKDDDLEKAITSLTVNHTVIRSQ